MTEVVQKNYSYAEMAYNAYAQQSNYKSLVSGADLPLFEVLSTEIKDAWFSAANAVLDHVEGNVCVSDADKVAA